MPYANYAKRDSGFGEQLYEVPFSFYTGLSAKRNDAKREKVFIKGFTDVHLEEIFPPKKIKEIPPKKINEHHDRAPRASHTEFRFYLGLGSERETSHLEKSEKGFPRKPCLSKLEKDFPSEPHPPCL